MNENIITKAKLNINNSSFEFEGSESFVKDQVSEILKKLNTKTTELIGANSTQEEIEPGVVPIEISTAKNATSVKRRTNIVEPKILDNLIPNSEKISDLKTFFLSKKPNGHLEIYAVLAYWMKQNLGVENLSIDEIYTCYKIINIKPPKVLVQVFRDGKSKKMWFSNGEKTGQYRLSVNGVTAVEHEIPSKTE